MTLRNSWRCKSWWGPTCSKADNANPGLNFKPGFFSVCSKAFFLDNFLSFFRASYHQIVGKRNNTEFAFKASLSEIKFPTNPGLTYPCFEQPGPDVRVLGRAQLDLHIKYFCFSSIITQSLPITLYDYLKFNVIPLKKLTSVTNGPKT